MNVSVVEIQAKPLGSLFWKVLEIVFFYRFGVPLSATEYEHDPIHAPFFFLVLSILLGYIIQASSCFASRRSKLFFNFFAVSDLGNLPSTSELVSNLPVKLESALNGC